MSEPPTLSDEHIRYCFHHLFLPPQLPTSNDTAPATDHLLVEELYNTLVAFKELVGPEHQNGLASSIKLLGHLMAIRDDDGNIEGQELALRLQGLTPEGKCLIKHLVKLRKSPLTSL